MENLYRDFSGNDVESWSTPQYHQSDDSRFSACLASLALALADEE
jgi:hypothetical protein